MARPGAVLALAATALVLLAGCGGGGEEASEPAAVAPPGAAVFLEAALRPTGKVGERLDALAERIAGIESLGGAIVSELERSAREDGHPFEYEREVEPWLGRRAGLFLSRYDGSSFEGVGLALETTDAGEAREFIESQIARQGEGQPRRGSFEGVDFEVDPSDGAAIGMIGELAVFAEDEGAFEEAVEAAHGDSLADSPRYADAAASKPAEAAADAYIDIGGMIRQSGSRVDPQVKLLFETAGLDLGGATALLSLVPAADRVALQLTSNLFEAGGGGTSGAENLLGSMPADAFAAVSAADFGERLGEALDRLDASGVPGSLAPHQLEGALRREGIDVHAITGNLGDAAVYASGAGRDALGGALVAEARNGAEAANAVSNLGLLLRANRVPGVSAVRGRGTNGFSVRSSGLGRKPLVVAARDGRIAVGYGRRETLAALRGGRSLSSTASFGEARAALGDTPLSGFADGPRLLRLVRALLPPDRKAVLAELRPYLSKVSYLALGVEGGSPPRLRLVAGLRG